MRRIDTEKSYQVRLFENIPAELKSRPQWVLRQVKKPIDPNVRERVVGARAGVPATWGRYEQVLERYKNEEFSGIGFEFDNNGLVGIDLDHVVDTETGELSEAALAIVEQLNSYTEFSPSGTGLHIIAGGEIPVDGRQVDVEKNESGKARYKYEVYKAGRYLTMTGNVYGNYRTIEQRPKEIRAFYKQFFPEESSAVGNAAAGGFDDGSDLQRGLARDKKLQELWNGERRHGDESRDDLALMNKLAYWCNCDIDQMCESFQNSPYALSKDEHHQKKLQRTDYLPRTAKAAISGCNKTAEQSRREFAFGTKPSLPSPPAIQLGGKMSFTEAISYAAQLDRKPWILINEDAEKTKIKVLPMELSRFIQERVQLIFVRDNVMSATFLYLYDRGRYRQISDNELRGCIRQFIPQALRTTRDVNEVFNDLTNGLEFVNVSDLDADENIINFQNGLLHLDTMELTPHTQTVLSAIQIPCNWNAAARLASGSVFLQYMQDLTGQNAEVLEILLEVMGLVISNVYGYRTKKALFLVGEGDTGKTQIKELLAVLIGHNNVSTVDLKKLCERFGTSNVYQKRLAGSNDMGYQTIDDMSVFKQLTGGDSVDIEFKYQGTFSYKFKGFCWFNTNKLPRFGGDKGVHVYERILPIYCSNVIPFEKRDPRLLEKMLGEKEAIVVAAIHALKRLIDRSYQFLETDQIRSLRGEYVVENSSLLTFLSDCCEPKEGEKIRRSDFKTVYREWCKRNNKIAMNDRESKELLEKMDTRIVKIKGIYYISGMEFSYEIKTEYFGFMRYDAAGN